MNMQENQNQTMMEEILRLKKEKDALILAHYYQRLELQQIADCFGDSFELAKKAKAAKNRLVVFCGVKFMAESAKILNPGKKVLLPRMDAGCPMADMITPDEIRSLREKYPDAAVVCYVNSSAETKAASDICVTSSNALKICAALPNRRILFVPDQHLGAYVAGLLPEKEVILYSGCCPVHHRLTEADVAAARASHPEALLAVHPECSRDVVKAADFVGSTSQILDFCIGSPEKEFIIGTEIGVVERLAYYHPEKQYHLLAPTLVCDNMKKATLADVLHVLREEANEIILAPELIETARLPLERMMASK